VKRFKDEELDFVYIDGNHEYSNVKKDIQLWYPKIKKGAYIAGDDYDWHLGDDVKRAVNEFFVEYDIIERRWIAKVI